MTNSRLEPRIHQKLLPRCKRAEKLGEPQLFVASQLIFRGEVDDRHHLLRAFDFQISLIKMLLKLSHSAFASANAQGESLFPYGNVP